MYEHWENCVTHIDDKMSSFIKTYFSREDRKCLIIAGAGFDPRARQVSKKLVAVLGSRLHALFIREERGIADDCLIKAADLNQKKLEKLVNNTTVEQIDIFTEDDAPVGGRRISQLLAEHKWPDDITDVVLDMSALSIGISFPAAKVLLQRCEKDKGISFHIMISSSPQLDEQIEGEYTDRSIPIHSFNSSIHSNDESTTPSYDLPPAKIWLPQLASGKENALEAIWKTIADNMYKVCPVLPFPASNPRLADDLINKYKETLSYSWKVDPRDLIYVSEENPLDSYRMISELKRRYDLATKEIYESEMILSPLGSKVMATGALMAAIKHGLTVQYVETLRYDFRPNTDISCYSGDNKMVHIWLNGPIYDGYDK